jgi:3'-5' exoribonuclease
MMGTVRMLSELRAGEVVEGVYACTRKDRLRTRAGAAYLALELRDRSGTVAARAFREADRLAGSFERGDVVSVRGRVERFRDELVLELDDIRRAEGEGAQLDPAAFLPTAYRDLDELDGFLEHLAGEVHDRPLRALLEALLGDSELRAQWRRAPCSRGGHHAYLGGLLEHTVSIATIAQELCQLHPRLNSDLMLSAAIVHDLGHTRAFSYRAEIALSEEGRLLGHLAIGQNIVVAAATGVGLDQRRLLALLHCLLAHHGPAGAPGGRFQSAEALALYRLNSLDAAVKGALEHGLP